MLQRNFPNHLVKNKQMKRFGNINNWLDLQSQLIFTKCILVLTKVRHSECLACARYFKLYCYSYSIEEESEIVKAEIWGERSWTPKSMLFHFSHSLSMMILWKGFPYRCWPHRGLCDPGPSCENRTGRSHKSTIMFISWSNMMAGLSEEVAKDVTGLKLNGLGLILKRARPRADYFPAPGTIMNEYDLENQLNR